MASQRLNMIREGISQGRSTENKNKTNTLFEAIYPARVREGMKQVIQIARSDQSMITEI